VTGEDMMIDDENMEQDAMAAESATDNQDEPQREEEALNPKRRGLGRGLNALFEDGEAPVYKSAGDEGESAKSGSGTGRMLISVDQLHPNENQPRRLFRDDTLEELADSLREHGILQPLLVRPHSEREGEYEIIAGERRWRAAQLAQIHDIPVIITQHDNAKMQEIALIENLQREDLNPVDEAAGYKYMMDEYGYTQDLLAKKMGKSRSHISNMLRLNEISPKVANHLALGDITMGHARALANASNPDKLVERVVEENLSVRETEKMVQRVRAAAEGRPAPGTPGAAGGSSSGSQSAKAADQSGSSSQASGTAAKAPGGKPGKDADILALEKQIAHTLGMITSIDQKSAQEGSLTIEYKSLDQFDYLLQRLSYATGVRLNK